MQVTWQHVERPIARLIMTVDHRLKARVSGTISFAGKLFKNDIISVVNLGSCND